MILFPLFYHPWNYAGAVVVAVESKKFKSGAVQQIGTKRKTTFALKNNNNFKI